MQSVKKRSLLYGSRAGFTIVEMLVVISVIAILAGVITVGYGSVQENARDQTRISDLEQIRLALNLYKQDLGAYPDEGDFEEVVENFGLEVTDVTGGAYVYNNSVTCVTGQYDVVTLRATMENEGNGNLAEVQNRCSGLVGEDSDFILILDIFES